MHRAGVRRSRSSGPASPPPWGDPPTAVPALSADALTRPPTMMLRLFARLLLLSAIVSLARAQLSCEEALDAQGNMTGPNALLMDASCGARIGDFVRWNRCFESIVLTLQGSYDDCATISSAQFCVVSALKTSPTAQGCGDGQMSTLSSDGSTALASACVCRGCARRQTLRRFSASLLR